MVIFFLISNIKITAQTNDFQPTVAVNSQVICANETATLVSIPSSLKKNKKKNNTLKAIESLSVLTKKMELRKHRIQH